MKNQTEKLRKQSHSPLQQRVRYLGINLPKETKDLYAENYDTNERNQTRHKQMERYSMLLGRKNQYCENKHTTKHNLQIQCDPYQITNDIFHRTRTKNFIIHMETQKTLNSQSSLEKEWSWRNQTFKDGKCLLKFVSLEC